MEQTIITHNGVDCYAKRDRYWENDNTSILLFECDTDYMHCVCTVNLGDKLPEDQAYIKDYSENEGILDALKEAGIVTDVIGSKASGWIVAPLCKLDLSKVSTLST